MKFISLLATLLVSTLGYAQHDPVIMTINGKSVCRSEFEYSYNKNNTENVIDKKSIDEYVDLFINYKLKVLAAEDANLDTLTSFRKEFSTYRDQQIRPAIITNEDVEKEARKIYKEAQERADNSGGIIKPAHIFVMLKQKASADEMREAKYRIDSIYKALLRGEDFADLAKKHSEDKASAVNGGELPWGEHGMYLKEFEEQAFSLKIGEMSKPFASPAGWHIILLKGKQSFFPYDSLRSDIMRFIEQRGIRDILINQRLDSLSKTMQPTTTPEKILEAKQREMEATNPNLKYLIQEYHDGLLLYEISSKNIWDRATKDEDGLRDYFNKNKKKYRWDEPRFKGVVCHVKNISDIKIVKNTIKTLPFAEWATKLRLAFNSDSILRIKVENGLFKKGDNAVIDRDVFKLNRQVEPIKDFPIDAVFGKKIKTPQELEDVRAQVLTDYQEELEREWVTQLRKHYPITVNTQILKTVNKH